MGLIKREYSDQETVITAENMNAIQDAILDLEYGLLSVDNKKSGEVITITDADKRGFRRLNIYGKTTQDGTPTPDAPVDLVSSVEGDSISVHVCGKNLFTGWIVGGLIPGTGADNASATQRRTGYLPIFAPGQKYRISGLPSTLYSFVAFYDADKVFIGRSAAAPYGGMLVEPPANAKYFRLTTYENPETTGTIAVADAMAVSTMIEAGNIVTEYERGKQIQTATISTPNGLRGVPVASGGNYTDANGQQWICDEIDIDRGVYVQRTNKYTVNGSTAESWAISAVQSVAGATRFDITTIAPRTAHQICLCNAYTGTVFSKAKAESCWCNDEATTNSLQFRICTAQATTIEEIKAYVQTNPVDVVYILAIPIETPLPTEEVAAYKSLYTHREHTTVSNDGFAYMELEHAMDAKKYIDSVMAAPVARLATINLPASKWTGSNSLYSQIVTIDGITEYSKVDLLPSVEQLAIFYNKDVAFVTENEDGVVTVYAIGDKPTLDYTMQAQITEVKV